MGDAEDRIWYCGNCLTTFQGVLPRCPCLTCRSPRPAEGWGHVWEEGEVIDRNYRVLRRLASGGAGITYVAREIGPDEKEIEPDLAVKVLYAHRDHGTYLERLSHEALILQKLAHPNIVEYRGFVHRTGHSPYLVTRFEFGGSLYDHIRRRGRLNLLETAGIGCQVLHALDRAHQAGVIHRDLKPENVLLGDTPPPNRIPHIRVADFGIAKSSMSLGGGLTRVGAFVGTPQFAAPEQFLGVTPTPATDVFATGALLYFCLCRQPLLPLGDRLDPEEARDLLLQKLPPRLPSLGEPTRLLRAMQETLEGAMAPEPADRLSVREMEQMLDSIRSGSNLARPALTMVPPEAGSDLPVPIGRDPDDPTDAPDAPRPAAATTHPTEIPAAGLAEDVALTYQPADPPREPAAPVPAPVPSVSTEAPVPPRGTPTPVAAAVAPVPPPAPEVVPAVAAAEETREAAVQPSEAPSAEASPPRPRRKGGGCRKVLVTGCVLFLLLGVLVIAAVVGAWLLLPDLLSSKGVPDTLLYPGTESTTGEQTLPSRVHLSAEASDEATRAEYRAVEAAFAAPSSRIAATCRVESPAYVTVVITPAGAVETATVTDRKSLSEAVATCLEKAVSTLSFPRTSDRPATAHLLVMPAR